MNNLICENCGVEITSEKIWFIHLNECNYDIIAEKIIKKLTNYESLEFPQLKKIASEKGINTYKMKKEDIIKELINIGN